MASSFFHWKDSYASMIQPRMSKPCFTGRSWTVDPTAYPMEQLRVHRTEPSKDSLMVRSTAHPTVRMTASQKARRKVRPRQWLGSASGANHFVAPGTRESDKMGERFVSFFFLQIRLFLRTSPWWAAATSRSETSRTAVWSFMLIGNG
jgi:hypothetical protein